MKFLRSKFGVVTAALVIVVALFVIRPGAQRLRSRIVASISLAVGRQVDIGSVQLRLLPQPGFDFENFIVHDDPAFGAEPMLRAQEVTAAIRLSSLLRGRLEISRLDLAEPSLNLVRSSEGHWNLENLLERVARAPVAPTGRGKADSRPGFPYIQAARARINLKLGEEKKPYALTDADFSFWQESENQWGMRLKAQPVRTDFNLGDTGTLRIEGSWQRAGQLSETPLNFNLQWDEAQLGQVSQLIQGADKGWRGSATLNTRLSGSPTDLSFQTNLAVQDFRRFDILGGGSLRLSAQCDGHYSTADHALSKISCAAPVGAGEIEVAGQAGGSMDRPSYQLQLAARDVPLSAIALVARHAKKDLPDDLTAEGTLSATLRINRGSADSITSWQGGGKASNVRIKSTSTRTQLALDEIPFTASQAEASNPTTPLPRRMARQDSLPSPEARIEIGPFNLPLGRPAPAVMQGWISRSGYSFALQGDSEVPRILQLARTVGLPASQPAASGLARLALHIDGKWKGFTPAVVTGTALLKGVRAELPGINAPLEIGLASLAFLPEGVSVRNIAASLSDTNWTGSLGIPRHCSLSANCLVQFDLHADKIATDDLNQLFNPNAHKRPWYRWLALGNRSNPSLLGMLRATGELAVNRFAVRTVVGTKVTAKVDLAAGKLRLSDLRGEVLGGKHVGQWQADFSSKPPRYTGSGTVQNASLRQLAQLMNDGWITGTASASYHITASGYTAADLISSAGADLNVEAHDGSLPHVVLGDAATPLLIHRLAGQLVLADGQFDIREGKLETPGSIYQVSGTASLGRKLDIKLLRDATHGFSVTGTLTEPRVAAAVAPETRAALKP